MIHPICTQYNSQSFKGLHAKPKDLRNLNTTKNYLLEIPEIKNCADNYEITIKKSTKKLLILRSRERANFLHWVQQQY